MFSYLREHPDIFMAELKEPHYFGKDHHRINHLPRTEESYLSLFAEAQDELAVGEASTSYLHSRSAATEIRNFSPSSKIIVMLRNPIDVMYAYHSTMLAAGFEFIEDFEAALAAEPQRKQGRYLPRVRPGIRENLYYREVASYTEQIERYIDVFGSSNVHVIIFDDLKKDTRKIYKDTLAFLGVCPEFEPNFRIVNPSHRPVSAAFNNFLWNPPRSVQSVVRRVMPAPMRHLAADFLKHFMVTHRPRPAMDPAQQCNLQAEFRPEVERLSKLLRRDLTCWCHEP